MTEYIFAGEEHRADIIDFINYIFSQSARPHDFKTLIPKVYADGRGYDDIHSIVLVDGYVRGCVAQYPFTLDYAGAPLSIGYIGSVSTYKYTRGAGYMKALMQMQIDRAGELCKDIMLLGGQKQRYEYYGFTPCGSRIEYRVFEANVRHGLKNVDASGINWKKFEDATLEQLDAAYEIYMAQLVTGARPREDFDLVLRTWELQPYVVLDGARVVGFLAARGREHFPELVLTDASFVPKLIKAWFAVYEPNRLDIELPLFDAPMNRELSSFAEGFSISNGEQARIINLQNVLRACLSLKRAACGLKDGKVVMQMDDEAPVCASVRDGAIDVYQTDERADIRLNRLDMQAYLFCVNRYAAPDIQAPVDWFPLPLYVSKPDHF